MPAEKTVDFDAVERWLAAAGATWQAAEAHGAFCGRACMGGVAALRDWLDEVLDRAPHSVDVLSLERQAGLQAAAAVSLVQLEAGQMQFSLMLPADNAALERRVAALADWCHGFMQGLAAGGAADAGQALEALATPETSEILRDFSELTRAVADAAVNEADEQAFAEIVEYVRVSVQLIYDDTAAYRNTAAAASGPGS